MAGLALALAVAQPLREMRLVEDAPRVTTAAQKHRDPVAKAVGAVDRALAARRGRRHWPRGVEFLVMTDAALKRARRQVRNLAAVAAGGMVAFEARA